MTPRERQTSGAYSTAIADLPQTHVSGMVSETGVGETHWEALYSCLSSLEHRELVDLARQQGLLYAFPLPKISRDGSVRLHHTETARPHLLARLLQGDAKELAAAPVEMPSAFWDEQLHPLQRNAVGLALSSPDICLIQTTQVQQAAQLAGEIITQAAQGGQRVLFLSRTPAALDAALEKVAGREPIYALRCTGRDETPETLPPNIRALTFSERRRILRERAFDCAQQANAETQRRLQCHAAEEQIWRELEHLAEQYDQIEQSLLCVEQQKCRQQLEEVSVQLEKLRPLAQAKQQRRWWSLAWWRATEANLSRCTELETQEKELQESLNQLEQRLRSLSGNKDGESGDEPHTQRSNGKWHDSSAAKPEQVLTELKQQGRQLADKLEIEALRPEDFSTAAIQQARQQWEQHCTAEQEKAHFLVRWLQYLEEFGDELAQRLPRLANVVAATLDTLPTDENFGSNSSDQTFDLLVLAEADQFSEAELMQAAQQAARWVFIGKTCVTKDSEQSKGSRKKRGEPHRAGKDACANCFDRLNRLLHCNPSSSHYHWDREEGRLRCRLRRITSKQRNYLETETVADQPDIELRILNQPHVEPILAEVVFPASTALAQAKEFIYRELEEVALQTPARNLYWQADEQRLILHLTDTLPDDPTSVMLEEGIREHFIWDDSAEAGNPCRCRTLLLEFDRTHGWDVQRAREWLHQRLGWSDLGRSIILHG